MLEIPARAKEFGAYYTAPTIAKFLSQWAIRTRADRVLDPCFGGGVFVRAACEQLFGLGGKPAEQVCGYEVDADVFGRVASGLRHEWNLGASSLRLADFFSVEQTQATQVDVVVGNPPYIRYQRFSGQQRREALRKSSSQGVNLQELSSSWAPFLVHAISMLRPGGRLAMVIPMEIAHARYALPVLAHLRSTFSEVSFLTFREKLFPQLSEDVVLVLAEGRGEHAATFRIADYCRIAEIENAWDSNHRLRAAQNVDAEAVASASTRLIEYLMPAAARRLYGSIKESHNSISLRDIADVGIGYVTGDNGFFHLDEEDVHKYRIPRRFLKPVVRRGRALTGIVFNERDWRTVSQSGNGGYLLHVPKEAVLPTSLRDYLDAGVTQGVPKAYKCRTRSCWYSVPHVRRPDAFLTYMSGVTPSIAANVAGVYAPNTLHVVRMHPMSPLPPLALAAAWQTSLTRLSVEIEGHPLGGGMLKLEPNEAKRVLLPNVGKSNVTGLLKLAEQLDELKRAGEHAQVQQHADEVILRDMLGFDDRQCRLLARAASLLASRRGYGSSWNGAA